MLALVTAKLGSDPDSSASTILMRSLDFATVLKYIPAGPKRHRRGGTPSPAKFPEASSRSTPRREVPVAAVANHSSAAMIDIAIAHTTAHRRFFIGCLLGFLLTPARTTPCDNSSSLSPRRMARAGPWG